MSSEQATERTVPPSRAQAKPVETKPLAGKAVLLLFTMVKAQAALAVFWN